MPPPSLPLPIAMNPPPDPLDRLLDRWTETPEPPPHLRTEVWRRIAEAETAAARRGGAWATIEGWFARPPFATMFVVSCALLGLFLAEVRVSHLQREHSEQLARSYLQLIDPLLTADASRP